MSAGNRLGRYYQQAGRYIKIRHSDTVVRDAWDTHRNIHKRLANPALPLRKAQADNGGSLQNKIGYHEPPEAFKGSYGYMELR